MEQIHKFQSIYSELLSNYTNLGKDNQERRKNVEVLNKNYAILLTLEKNFQSIKHKFNEQANSAESIEEARNLTSLIEKLINDTKKILDERLQIYSTLAINVDSQQVTLKTNFDSSNRNSQTINMAFDLKTATSLLPVMDDKENTTKQLIDAIELYDSMLDNANKKLLTNFVLKTRLSQAAKIRLQNSYMSNQLLIQDMRKHLITKQSASSLSIMLHNARQNHKSIDDFGKDIEELMLNLTISQSDGKPESVTILRETNEKLAINSFANGLRDSELRTIVKSRNFLSLKDAISAAKDENNSKPGTSNHVFHFNRGRNFCRGNLRTQNSKFKHGNNNRFGNSGNFHNNYNRNQFQNSQNYSTRARPNSHTQFRQNRSRNFRGHFSHRGYYMRNSSNTQNVEKVENNPTISNSKFFRTISSE